MRRLRRPFRRIIRSISTEELCKQLSKKKREANRQPSARIFAISAVILESKSEVLQVAIEIDHDRQEVVIFVQRD